MQVMHMEGANLFQVSKKSKITPCSLHLYISSLISWSVCVSTLALAFSSIDCLQVGLLWDPHCLVRSHHSRWHW
jgi:hypothetical protein